MNFYEFVCICLLSILVVAASHKRSGSRNVCSSTYTRSTVRLPSHSDALSLADFNTNVVTAENLAVLYAILTPTADAADYIDGTASMNLEFTMDSPTGYTLSYTRRRNTNDCPDGTGTLALQVEENCERAVFNTQESPRRNIRFVSSCPQDYVLLIQCRIDVEPSEPSKVKTCPIENLIIEVLLRRDPKDGPPDNVSMYNIVNDLKRATGLKFGTGPLDWHYLFGLRVLDGAC